MSPWRPESQPARRGLALGLDARQLAWIDGTGAGAAALHATHHEGLSQALAAGNGHVGVDVIAASDIAVHWLQKPPTSVASLDELRLVAAARCAHLHGGSPEDWWVTGDWDSRASFACAALPQAVIKPLEEQFAASGTPARWHTAWGVVSQHKAGDFPDNGWSALRSPTRVLLWHCREGAVNCLATLSLPAGAGEGDAAERVRQQVAVEASRTAEVTAGPVTWLDLGDGVATEASTALGLRGLLYGGAR